MGALAAVLLHLPERVAAMLTAFGGGLLCRRRARAGARGRCRRRHGVTARPAAGTLALRRRRRLADPRAVDAVDAAVGPRRRRRRARWRCARRRRRESARGEAIAAGHLRRRRARVDRRWVSPSPRARPVLALLAGVLIGNVVEAYGATQPIVASGDSRSGSRSHCSAASALALRLATVLGGTVLADVSDELRRHRAGGRRRRGAGGGGDRGHPVRLRRGEPRGRHRHRRRLRSSATALGGAAALARLDRLESRARARAHRRSSARGDGCAGRR